MTASSTDTVVKTTIYPQTLLPLDSPLRRVQTDPATSCRACEFCKGESAHLGQRHCHHSNSNPANANTSNLNKMASRHRRPSSPRRLAIPGRSSGSSFDDYDESYYSRSPRDYTPSSRDPYYSSYLPRASTTDAYSGYPRRSTLTKERPVITTGSAVSPSRYDRDRDDHSKSIISPRTAHKKVYSFDRDGSGSRLVEEHDVARGDYSDTERPHREKRYHLTGSYNRPREIDDDGYSYTDPAAMYRDTEPRHRRRRGSVEGGRESRRSSIQDAFDLPSRSSTRDSLGPPPIRALDRLNDSIARRETVPLERERDPRTASLDRSNTHDPYLTHATYDMPMRGTKHLSNAGLPFSEGDRYGGYDRSPIDDGLDPRRSRQRFDDPGVPLRGFGIRSASVGKPDISPERDDLEEGRRPISSIYATEALIPQPNVRDYIPPKSLEDERREREKERKLEKLDRERERDQYERELEVRDRKDREREVDRDPRPVDRDRERHRDRDYDRRRDRDDYDRKHDDRERSRRERDADHLRHAANATVAAAGVGAAAYAARLGAEKREKERELDRDRDQPRDLTREREGPRGSPRDGPREREGSKELPRDPLRESTLEVPRESTREVPRESSRDIPRDLSRDVPRDVTRDKDRERDKERDRERDREHEQDRPARREEADDTEPPRRSTRREPNEREDVKEREYTDSRRMNEVDADEDYNRRLQQQQQELSRLSVPNDQPPSSSAPQSRHNSVQDNRLVKEPSPISPQNPTMSGALAIIDRSAPTTDLAPPSSSPISTALTIPGNGGVSPTTRDRELSSSRDSRVYVVDPPRKEVAAAPVKGILRKPTEKFPDHKDDIREGVKPLKEEAERKGIPVDAKWTKIDRRLVNPEALIEAQERFEERLDFVIVLRVLTKEEIQKFADRTREIRGLFFPPSPAHFAGFY
jgi:zinc finger CCCH domain-containing protein 13